MASVKKRPVVLVILDGWGYSEDPDFNAIFSARKPHWDKLWANYPHTLIQGSGTDVGLPAGQMGNSEVGHLNLGAGRVVYQELTRIERAIKSGMFFTNKTLTDAVDKAIASNKAVHILGLLSPGGVHSHEEHLHAMIKLAAERGAPRIYLHAFLDGRDTPPRSAATSIAATQAVLKKYPQSRFASVIGRYFAMDRDKRWPRVQAAYDLITQGKALHHAPDAASALEMAYARDESDEFAQATALVAPGEAPVHVTDGDVVIFMNYRSDRARELTEAFIQPNFDGFKRDATPHLGSFVSLTEYKKDYGIPVAFPTENINNVLGAYIAKLGMRQLRIAETEKYAHVTFFFNGGEETPFVGEDRILVPSPNVATYDLQPEMNAPELTDRLIEAIDSRKYDVIICNYANPDMVGHSGKMEPAIKAIEVIDTCLGRLHSALQKVGGEMLITADHGNAEQMRSEETGQAHTAHTNNPVPFIYVGRKATAAARGSLADVAPTLLYLLGVPQPAEMNGQPLMKLTVKP